jgi:hypothetical protein
MCIVTMILLNAKLNSLLFGLQSDFMVLFIAYTNIRVCLSQLVSFVPI